MSDLQHLHASPFLNDQPSTAPLPPPQPTPVERNRGRGFRRAGNACEIAAGAALNSAIVFLFHLLQVHPVGFLVALGVSHFYFTATALGEGNDRFVGNVMTGCSAGLAAVCSFAEPIGEWWEARDSKTTAIADLQALYAAPQPKSGWGWTLVLALLLAVLIAVGGKRK